MTSFPILWLSATLTLSGCFRSSQFRPTDSLGLCTECLNRLLSLLLDDSTSLSSFQSYTIPFLFRLLWEDFAILDYVVKYICFCGTNWFVLSASINPIGLLNPCEAALMYPLTYTLTRRKFVFLNIKNFLSWLDRWQLLVPNLASYFKVIDLDNQSLL
jgi:hypothetical protein